MTGGELEERDNVRSRQPVSTSSSPAAFTEGECVPTNACRCQGHSWPGVHHLVACDQPHIDSRF